MLYIDWKWCNNIKSDNIILCAIVAVITLVDKDIPSYLVASEISAKIIKYLYTNYYIKD